MASRVHNFLPVFLAILLFHAGSASAQVSSASPTDCIRAVAIRNSTGHELTLTISGEGIYQVQKLGPGEHAVEITGAPCVNVTLTGTVSLSAVSAAPSKFSTPSSIYDYAARLKAKNQPQSAPATATTPAALPPATSAADIAAQVAGASAASLEEKRARDAAAASTSSSPASSTPSNVCIHGYPLGECCNEAKPSEPAPAPASSSPKTTTPSPTVSLPTVAVATSQPAPTAPPGGIKFIERREFCVTNVVKDAWIKITEGVFIAPVVQACPDRICGCNGMGCVCKTDMACGNQKHGALWDKGDGMGLRSVELCGPSDPPKCKCGFRDCNCATDGECKGNSQSAYGVDVDGQHRLIQLCGGKPPLKCHCGHFGCGCSEENQCKGRTKQVLWDRGDGRGLTLATICDPDATPPPSCGCGHMGCGCSDGAAECGGASRVVLWDPGDGRGLRQVEICGFSPKPPDEDEDDLDTTPLPQEILDEIQRQKDEEDAKIDEELRKIQEEIDAKKKKLDEERERRRRNPERERNAREQERLQKERERLERDRDKIREERDRREKAERDDDQLDKDLRKAEQEMRERDRNCATPECRTLREQRAQLQQRRVQRAKDGVKADKAAQKFEREIRDFDRDRESYEDRLDRGVGLTPEERRARAARQKAEEARQELDRVYERYQELDEKRRNNRPMTEDEAQELRDINRAMDRAQRTERERVVERYERLEKLEKSGKISDDEKRELRGLRNWEEEGKRLPDGDAGPWTGWKPFTARVNGLERDAAAEYGKLVEKQGGSFEDWGSFFRNTSSTMPGGDDPGFGSYSSDDLKNRSDRLGKASADIQDARDRVGEGGVQGLERSDALRALDRDRAEIERRSADLQETQRKMNVAMNAREKARTEADNDQRNGGERGLKQKIEDARRNGRPYSEIQELERKLADAEFAANEADRDFRRLQREADAMENDVRGRMIDYNSIGRYSAMGDVAHNSVRDYNKGYGDMIDADGNVDPDAMRRHVNGFERDARAVSEEEGRIRSLEEVRDQLSKPTGEGRTYGGDLGLTPDEISEHERSINARIIEARRRSREAQENLSRSGFRGHVDDEGRYRVDAAPQWAGAFGRAAQTVEENKLKEEARRAAEEVEREAARNRPPELDRPPVKLEPRERLDPEALQREEARDRANAERIRADHAARQADADAREKAAAEGGFEAWRAERARQREVELAKLRAVPQRDSAQTERVTRLEDEKKREEAYLEAEKKREASRARMWDGWAREAGAARRQEEEERRAERTPAPVERPSAPTTEVVSMPEQDRIDRIAENDRHLAELARSGRRVSENNLDDLRERRNRLQRDLMDVEAARARRERDERVAQDDARGERLGKQSDELSRQIAALDRVIRNTQEEKTERAFEGDHERALREAADRDIAWEAARRLAERLPEKAEVKPGDRASERAATTPAPTTERPRETPVPPPTTSRDTKPAEAPPPTPERPRPPPGPTGERSPAPTTPPPATTARDTRASGPGTTPERPPASPPPAPEPTDSAPHPPQSEAAVARASGEAPPSDTSTLIDPRARLREWIRANLVEFLGQSPQSREILPQLVMQLADKFGEDRVAAVLVRVLARLRGEGTVTPARFVSELFEESARGPDADGRRTIRLSQAELLGLLLGDKEAARAWGVNGPTRKLLRERLDAIIGELGREFGEKASVAEREGRMEDELAHLSSLLSLRALASDSRDWKPILRRIEILHDRLTKAVESRDGARGLSAATASSLALERLLESLPETATDDERRLILERLREAYALRRITAGRLAAGSGPERDALLEHAFDAGVREVRALTGLGKLTEALALLRNLQGPDDASRAVRARLLASLLRTAEQVYDAVTDGERTTLGRKEALADERKRVLEEWMRAEPDAAKRAAAALELSRFHLEGNNREAAKRVFDEAIRMSPDDPLLLGNRLAFDAANLPASELLAALNRMPAEARAAAVAILAERLSQQLDDRSLENILSVLDRVEGLSPRAREALGVQTALARVEALRRAPAGEGSDARAAELLADARRRLESANNLDEASRLALTTALATAALREAQFGAWKRALEGSAPPPGGYTALAREALQAGRLDLAGRALAKQMDALDAAADRVGYLRGYGEINTIIQLVRARLNDPSLTETQKNAANDFLRATGNEVRRRVRTTLDGEENLLARAAMNLRERREGQAAGTVTEKQFNAEQDRYIDFLRDHRALARIHYEAGLSLGDLATAEADISTRIRALEEEIRTGFANLGKTMEEPERRRALDEKLGRLNALRAEREAAADYHIARSGRQMITEKVGYNDEHRTALEWELWRIDRDLNGFTNQNAREVSYGVRGRWRGASGWRKFTELSGDDKDRQRDLHMLEDEIHYYERRRLELVMENPHLTIDEKRGRYNAILSQEAARWKAAGENISPLLFPELSGLGKAEIEMAKAQQGRVAENRLQWLRDDLDASRRENDPQKGFLALVQLREASLAGQYEAYVNYLDVPWYRRGPVRGARIGLYHEETAKELLAASDDIAQLHQVLIRAAYRPVDALAEADRAFLEERGFIVNGRYRIPSEITLEPTKAAAELANEGKLAAIDKYVNAAFAAELAATVVLPGGISGRFAAGAFGRVALGEIIQREGIKVTARYLVSRTGAAYIATWGAEKTLEAALFTALSRGARTAINPEMILDDRLWSMRALGSEFLHNAAVISALNLGGGAMRLGQEGIRRAIGDRISSEGAEALFRAAAGSITATGEAALLTGLNRLLSGNQITQDDFIGNLLTVAMLRASHIGGEQGQGRVSQTRDAMEIFDRFLTDEYLPVRRLMEQYGGSWNALKKAFLHHDVSDAQMRAVFNLRKEVIDDLAAEIVKELKESFGEASVKAFGSSNLTSDYDLSFYGPKAELAVILFNARFGSRWGRALELGGKESAGTLDVNFYTNPVFDLFRGGKDDIARQDDFGYMAARKYLNDRQWGEHRRTILENIPEAQRADLNARLDRIEGMVKEANGKISRFEAELRAEAEARAKELAGARVDNENIEWAARNRLYEENLREIIRLKEAHENAAPAEKEAIAQQLRDAQSRALYFAAEAYQTEAAIKHVVLSIQAAGRKITAASLLSPERPQLSIPLTEAQGRQSYNEQIANMLKEYNHGGDPAKLATKVAKYFIRALDAARISGVELEAYRDVVEATCELDANRDNMDNFKKVLEKRFGEKGAQAYIDSVFGMMNRLTGEVTASGQTGGTSR
ncbi:MAG: hypothetical protein AAB229_07140 [Candidatus Hydrogenedentota bacterium]